MTVQVKICGLTTADAVTAAAAADFAGFVFYPHSPRAVTAEQAATLAEFLPGYVQRVAVMVDPDDALLAATLAAFRADYVQLHGGETPDRASAIRRQFAIKVIKALPVGTAADLDAAGRFAAADMLLFDARPPIRPDALPGGNAASFDWGLLAGRRFAQPWLLSGGLHAGNVATAVRASGARAVDVSSGVEDRPGHKDPARIAAFLAAARDL